jgi:hypothetical protein
VHYGKVKASLPLVHWRLVKVRQLCGNSMISVELRYDRLALNTVGVFI